MLAQREAETARIAGMQQCELTDDHAESLILRACVERGIVSQRHLSLVYRQWHEPEHDAFRPRTAWSLLNAFRVLEVRGKGGKERRVPLHPEAFERLEAWLDAVARREEPDAALFPPTMSARGRGHDGFLLRPLSRRSVQCLVKRYVKKLALDPAVTVHSFRVTAITSARERGSDVLDLQIFAGHADPRTTLTYIRSRDRLSKSPAYVLNY